jgi:hypothetical protein
MAFVVTEGASISCGHVPGKVSATASQTKLTVAGKGVLLAADVTKKPVANCPVKPAAPATEPTPCLTCNNVTAGESHKLTLKGKPVLLSTLAGTTDGKPPGVLSVISQPQTKLSAS